MKLAIYQIGLNFIFVFEKKKQEIKSFFDD